MGHDFYRLYKLTRSVSGCFNLELWFSLSVIVFEIWFPSGYVSFTAVGRRIAACQLDIYIFRIVMFLYHWWINTVSKLQSPLVCEFVLYGDSLVSCLWTHELQLPSHQKAPQRSRVITALYYYWAHYIIFLLLEGISVICLLCKSQYMSHSDHFQFQMKHMPFLHTSEKLCM